MDTLETLAKRVGLSRTTVSKDLKWLTGETHGSTRRFFRIVPNLDENALGVETIDVFLETNDAKSIVRLERLCDYHPYTKYRARCFGRHTGLFTQFRIPHGSLSLMTTFFDRIQELGLIERYTVLPIFNVQPIFSVSQLKNWDSTTFAWQFDWDKWTKTKVSGSKPRVAKRTSLIHLLTKRDISILSNLSRGARRKQKDIIEELRREGINFTSQDFSRRLDVLKNHFILGYHLFLDQDAFDLYSNVILTARCSRRFARELSNRMLKLPIPFRSTLKASDDFMLWSLRLPPTHLSALLEYLQKKTHELNVSIIDYMKSEVYGIWAGSFDESKHQWITDYHFFVDEPISRLRLKQK